MRELPILFNIPMVQAIQDLLKNMTRRLNNLEEINQEPDKWRLIGLQINSRGNWVAEFYDDNGHARSVKCPYQPGDRLYVRETWYYESHMRELTAGEPDLPGGLYSHRFIYRASSPDYPINVGVGEHGWRPSIHMPKVAARIWLEVTNVRVERLQEISNADRQKEGIRVTAATAGELMNDYKTAEMGRNLFTQLWNSTIKKQDLPLYGWDANPWVWVIEFKKI